VLDRSLRAGRNRGASRSLTEPPHPKISELALSWWQTRTVQVKPKERRNLRTGRSRDYAFDGRTALVVPPKRPDLVAEAITRLFRDRALLERLAIAGCDHVQRYRWSTSVDALEYVLRG
jgi:hypothetical protein